MTNMQLQFDREWFGDKSLAVQIALNKIGELMRKTN